MNSATNISGAVTYRRTQYRLALHFPLEISGCDERGKSFVAVAQVCNVSSEGGCIAIKKDLAKGEKIQLVTPKGAHFVARVRWSQDKGEGELRYAGFDIIDAILNVVAGKFQLAWFFME